MSIKYRMKESSTEKPDSLTTYQFTEEQIDLMLDLLSHGMRLHRYMFPLHRIELRKFKNLINRKARKADNHTREYTTLLYICTKLDELTRCIDIETNRELLEYLTF
jgi:hypothetical protein